MNYKILFLIFLFILSSCAVSIKESQIKGPSFTSFEIQGYKGEFNDTTITVIVPENYELYALIPKFTTSIYSKVYIDDTEQVSGENVINFFQPVNYKVVSLNNSEKEYKVIVLRYKLTNTIKITSIDENSSSKTFNFEFTKVPNNKYSENINDDLLYCLNSNTFDTPIDIYKNIDLVFYSDFACDGLWSTYEELNKNFELENNKEAILNVAVKFEDGSIKEYNRLYLKTNLTLVDDTITCSDLFDNINDSSSIVLTSNIDCNNVDISTINETYENLYFNANGFTINNVTINSSSQPSTGIFGKIDLNSYLANINITNIHINAEEQGHVGGVCGISSKSSIENISLEGEINARDWVGGITGHSYKSNIINSNAQIQITSNGRTVGGLAGYFLRAISADFPKSYIINSYSSGDITSCLSSCGGLVGELRYYAMVKNSYSSVNITADEDKVGGLIGHIEVADLEKSFSEGEIEGYGQKVGGLFGYAAVSNISNSYSTANVVGHDLYSGGFAGYIDNPATITNSYSIGTYSDKSFAGYVHASASILNSYSLELDPSGDVTILNQSQFSDEANFPSFDFINTWQMPSTVADGDFIRPRLKWE